MDSGSDAPSKRARKLTEKALHACKESHKRKSSTTEGNVAKKKKSTSVLTSQVSTEAATTYSQKSATSTNNAGERTDTISLVSSDEDNDTEVQATKAQKKEKITARGKSQKKPPHDKPEEGEAAAENSEAELGLFFVDAYPTTKKINHG